MTVSHEEIMAEVREMKDQMVVKDDLAILRAEFAEFKAAQEATKELVEALAFVKTGSKIVVGASKLVAGLIAIWVLLKGGAQFIMEIGKQ